MDPSLAAPIATLTGAIATAILMWASYNYPRGYHRRDAGRDEHEDDDAAVQHQRLDPVPEPEPEPETPEPEPEESVPDPEPVHPPKHAAPEPEADAPVATKPPVKRAPRTNTSGKKAPPRKIAHPSKPKDPDGPQS